MLAYKFRLNPDTKRSKGIDSQIETARLLYNKLLEKTRDEYRKNKTQSLNIATLNRLLKISISENPEFGKIHSQVRQNVFMRLKNAYGNFFRRVKEKKTGKRLKAGFPRFKAKGRYASITYPQSGFSIESKRKRGKDHTALRLSRVGTVKILMHREIDGNIKTLTIKKEAGKYYAIFSVQKDVEIPKVNNTKPVGIDMDLESFATLSDGRKIIKPDFFEKKKDKIKFWQRKIAKCSKGSRRRERKKERLRRTYKKIADQNKDFMHKTANELIEDSGYTSFAVERLNIANMVKNHNLAGSIQNATWRAFTGILSYKAEEAGIGVVHVDPRNTSQICSKCGSINKILLSERVFMCGCGYMADRDINAAINILKRATFGQRGSNAQGDGVRPKKGAAADEMRTYPADNAGGSLGLKPEEDVT